MLRRQSLWLSMIAGCIACQSAAEACSVPVFRYALERWQPDPYQIVLFHQGELTPELDQLAKSLDPANSAGDRKIFANVQLRTIDVNAIDPSTRTGEQQQRLWESLGTPQEQLPRLVLYYPLTSPLADPLWQGEPTAENVAKLLNSPVRQEVAERILKGDTAVWLFLDSGDKAKDDAAFARLTAGVAAAQQEIELPPADPQDVEDGLITVDQNSLKIRFSTLRLSRDDPAEAPLVSMLLHSERDLLDEQYTHEPMAFAIFGRGRALLALVGGGIERETVLADGQFLCGACTCQIKNQNPGVDLLTSVDWESLVSPQLKSANDPPPLPSLAEFVEPETTAAGDSNSAMPSAKSAAESESQLASPAETSPNETGATEAKSTETPSGASEIASTNVEVETSSMLSTTFVVLGVVVIGVAGLGLVLLRK